MGRHALPPRIQQRDGYWYVYWYDEEAREPRRESLGTEDPAEARRRFSEWLAITEESARTGDLTVSQALAHYVEHRKFRRDASRQRALDAQKHLDRHLGHLQVADLIRAHGRTYAARRDASDGTVYRELGVLMAALNFCRDDGLIDHEIRRLERPETPPPRDRWLTVDEIDCVLKAAEAKRWPNSRLSRAERFIWIALEAGARKESIERLTWPQVDLAQKLIDFRTPGKKQTKKRQAVVPISDRLLPVLQTAWDERTSDIWVLDMPGSIRSGFQTVMREAKLPEVTPHTLRHTCATHLARAGTPMFVIAQILGDSIQTVTRNYLHHDPNHSRDYLNYERK